MADGQKLKVFLSYSRKDSSDFADELVAGLELAGFAPFLDRHDIAAGEDWETRLGGLIHEADTVVYVISPEAVKSERCSWEVDKTLALSKRLIPVIYKSVSEAVIPERLRRLQFIRFDAGLGITRPLAQLAEALRQDLEWIREHTRIAELAARWQARGRPSSLLLRGDDLATARAWAARRKSEAPEITEVQRDFLNVSVAVSRFVGRRRLLVQALVAGLAVIIVAGLLAWWQDQWIKERYFWLAYFRNQGLTTAKAPGESFWECAKTDMEYSKYCPEMVVVPAGKFMMGSLRMVGDDHERPQHEVVIAKPFAVSKFELTFDQWDACIQGGGCGLSGGDIWGRGKHPALGVSWGEAQQYVKWLSTMTGQDYRLLSEAEWEYAARAGTTTRWSSGDYEAEAALGDYAWYYENSGNRTHPVGQKKPNAFGLHDMHGNLWEWVEDCYHDNYDAAPADGKPRTEGADCNGRVVRGGSWGTVPNMLRSAFREWVHLEGESPRGGPVVERSQCLHLAVSDMSRCPTLESAKRSKADFDQAASPIVIL